MVFADFGDALWFSEFALAALLHKTDAALTSIIVAPQLKPYSVRGFLQMGLQIVEDIYGFNNGDKRSDLA